jgi:hypothetical protein
MSLSDILKISIVLSWLFFAVFYSMTTAINIPTFHLDGAFQTASGLYRLDAGQFPGRDFFPYLGVGPLFLLYPFFKISGGNISASVFSSQFVVLFSGLSSVAFIWHLIWHPKSFITSLTVGCLLFLLPLAVSEYLSLPLPDWMSFQISPGHSLRPIRAYLPFLIGIIYYFFLLNINVPRTRYFFAGLLTGIILLWSNDFAIPTAGLFAIFLLANTICRSEFQLCNVLTYFATAILTWMILLALITHGHPMELLQYNFLDVAQDQWYFFGPYHESSRVMSIQSITLLFSAETQLPLFVLVFLCILATKTKLIEHVFLLWIGAVLFAGGGLASVGGHVGGYFGGFYFWGEMVILIGLARLAYLRLHQFFSLGVIIYFINIMLVIFFCLSVSFMLNSVAHFKSENLIASKDTNRFYVSELGGYLSTDWKDYINLARKNSESGTFEEYWGLWSATRKTFPNWPVDSVIHALGQTREKAKSALKNAKLIITTKESAFSAWVGWNISQSYWFYQDLIREWTPIYQSPLTTVWQKSKQNISSEEVSCQIVDRNIFNILVNQPGLLEVNIQYFVSGFRSLILLDNNFSFSPVSDGFVSLDPNASNALIPIYASNKGVNIYKVRFLPANRNATSKLKKCTAKLLSGHIVYGKTMKLKKNSQ